MRIKIDFCDFWPGFDKANNYFYNLLKEDYEIEISNNPDYLFFSVFGNNHQNYKCVKIFYTGENVPPPTYCDWSFSFEPTWGNNFRLPHYLLYDGYYELVNKKVDESLLNRKFCNFVASNPNCPTRNKFVEELSKYKKVDSGGRWMNNIGYVVGDKRKFQSEYKFSVAFENEAYRPNYEWYVTEKIMEPMTVNSIPIYKGGSKVCDDFNKKSFVNYHDFNNMKDFIGYIVYLDKNDDKYLFVLKTNWFDKNIIPYKKGEVKKFFQNIINLS